MKKKAWKRFAQMIYLQSLNNTISDDDFREMAGRNAKIILGGYDRSVKFKSDIMKVQGLEAKRPAPPNDCGTRSH